MTLYARINNLKLYSECFGCWELIDLALTKKD